MARHPFLTATDGELQAAAAAAGREGPGQLAARDLLSRARKGVDRPLPEFDHSGVAGVAQAQWRDIYPQVAAQTAYVPGPPAAACLDAALAWRLGLDEGLLAGSRRILDHFVQRYEFDIEHWDVGMNYAGWGMKLLAAYDLVLDQVSEDERRPIDAFFGRLYEAIDRDDRLWVEVNPGGKYNNHYAWHKWAIGCLGLFYDQPDWVERALLGPMGVAEIIEHGVMDDGYWFESSTAYHFTAVHGFVPLARALRNTGNALDLFTHVFGTGHSLHDLFTAPIRMAFPDLSLPVVGDCYGHRPLLTQVQLYVEAASVYDDPTLTWLVGRRPPSAATSLDDLLHPPPTGGEPPAAVSGTWPEHGYVMLRQTEGSAYWGSDSWAAFLSADRSSVHANADRLSLNLFGRGKLLAGNAEARASGHSFSSPVQRELNRTTLAKNAVMVDHASQRYSSQTLRISDFRSEDGTRAATIDDDGALYPGVRQRRTVVVLDEYVLDVYWSVGDGSHRHTWLVHVPLASAATTLSVSCGEGSPWPVGREFAWVRGLRQGATDETWTAEWDVEGVAFRATFAPHPGTRVIAADFPRTQGFDAPPIPLLGVEREAEATVFVVLYQAGASPLPDASVAVLPSTGAGLTVRVGIGDRTWHHHLSPLAGAG